MLFCFITIWFLWNLTNIKFVYQLVANIYFNDIGPTLWHSLVFKLDKLKITQIQINQKNCPTLINLVFFWLVTAPYQTICGVEAV